MIHGVSYTGKSFSPGYHTPVMKLREILTKIENILTHWSGAKADSKNEKMEVEYLVGLSLYHKFFFSLMPNC